MTWRGMTVSNHHRRIRQFVRPCRLRGKIPGQFARDRRDPRDHATLEIRALEFGFHIGADFLPAGGAYLGIDAAIGNPNLPPTDIRPLARSHFRIKQEPVVSLVDDEFHVPILRLGAEAVSGYEKMLRFFDTCR